MKYIWVVLLVIIYTQVWGQDNSNAGFLFYPDLDMLKKTLEKANEDNLKDSDVVTINIPLDNGSFIDFYVWESSVMSAEMETTFPDFKTYSIQSINNGVFNGRIFVSRFGIEGLIVREGYQIKIEPLDKNNPNAGHKSYKLPKMDSFQCGAKDDDIDFRGFNPGLRTFGSNGATRRTYEMAIATTNAFYTSANFGNSNNTTANAAVVNIINLNNLYWNLEMSVHFTIFETPFFSPNVSTLDPSSSNLTVEAARVIHAQFPGGNYDLGHALHAISSGGSGVAGLSVVCSNTFQNNPGTANDYYWKALGWSGGQNVNTLAVSIMVHEIGHMFGGPHTFNGIGGSLCTPTPCCTGQISSTNAFEIGSGTTIMSYAGLCQSDNNISSSPDLYFHARSLDNFLTYIGGTGGTCSTNTSSGNTPPSVNANPCGGSNYTIPRLTPFTLEGSATDPNNNQTITYTWEQYNEDGAGTPTQGFIGTTAGNSAVAPLFRSFSPSTTGNIRHFPSLPVVLNSNNVSSFEPLPNVNRTLNFRLTARDNNASNGGISHDNVSIAVNASVGPLEVSAPNTAVTWAAGSSQTITWSGSNTSFICGTVNIKLSIDGGNSYPYTLAAASSNDGTETLTIPANIPNTTTARIRVESSCWDCVRFFDVGNVNFTVTSSCLAITTSISPTTAITLPQGDPGLNLGLTNNLGSTITALSGTISNTDSPGNLIFLDNTPAVCTNGGNPVYYEPRVFVVDVSGNYSIAHGGAFGTVINIYSGAFSGTNCVNHIGSNATQPSGSGGLSLSANVTLSLNAGQIYYICISGFNTGLPTHPFNYNITFPSKPSGSNIYNGLPLLSGYSFTYIAVNIANNQIQAFNNSSNFTSLVPGNYSIYGAMYYSGSGPIPPTSNPSNWLNQPLNSILGNECIALSNNSKPVTVTSTCSSTVSNSNDSGTGSLRSALDCNTEGSTITFAPSVTQVTLTSGLTVTKNITLQGQSNTSRPEIRTSSSGITINAGKTLTLQNVDIKHSGSQTINGAGTLLILGTTVGKP